MKNPYFDLIRTVWRYGAPWRRSIVGFYMAYVIAQAALGIIPYTIGRTIDVLQHFKPDHLSHVIAWLMIGIAAELVFWIFHGPARVVERRVALNIQQTYRLNIYQQLLHLPLAWHQDHHSGNSITRLNRAAIALRQFAENQFIYSEAIVKFFVSIGFLLWVSLPIGLLSIVASVVIAVMIFLFDRKLIPLYHAENEVDNHVGAGFFDYISNMATVLTLRLGRLTHQNLFQRMKAVWPFFRIEVVLNETKWFAMMILLSIFQAMLLIGYIIHTLHATGTILIGLVIMISRYQWELNHVFMEVSAHYSELVRMNADVEGIQPILNDIKKFARLPQGTSTARQWHTIQLTELSFHHARKSEHGHIINRVNFAIKRGEKIALIGASGGGKSTLLNLLSGLYTPSYVRLLIDGVFFDSLEPLQAITTLIPQDPEIFENTIAFNITMDLSTTEDDIQNAAKLACFLPVLDILPSGFNTDIREKGLNLSVGQKQRLALARGLFAARFSSLILMDEPTSSVDLATEKEILSGIIQAFPEAAMIVSLHRLHLLPQFDSVIMLSHGKIVASGSTAELLQNSGPVYDLWKTYSS